MENYTIISKNNLFTIAAQNNSSPSKKKKSI